MIPANCLKVDLGKVASVMGYTNVASVGNRFRSIRKRYNLRLECKNTGAPSKAKNGSGASKRKDTPDSGPDDADASDTPVPAPAKKPRGRKPQAKPAEKANRKKAAAANKSQSTAATGGGSSSDSKPQSAISEASLHAVDLVLKEEEDEVNQTSVEDSNSG